MITVAGWAAYEAEYVTIGGGARTAIFIGVFFLLVIGAIIWWLRR